MQADWFHTNQIKGKFNQIMKIKPSFTHHHVFYLKLYDFFSGAMFLTVTLFPKSIGTH